MALTTLFNRAASMAAACSRHVSRTSRHVCRTSRRLCLRSLTSRWKFSALSCRGSVIPFLSSKRRVAEEKTDESSEEEEDEVETEGVWRRSILMGEKCQPLDFSGVIYYDSDGHRLAEIPTQRSPLRSPAINYYSDLN